jgi:hypothetical protein
VISITRARNWERPLNKQRPRGPRGRRRALRHDQKSGTGPLARARLPTRQHCPPDRRREAIVEKAAAPGDPAALIRPSSEARMGARTHAQGLAAAPGARQTGAGRPMSAYRYQ